MHGEQRAPVHRFEAIARIGRARPTITLMA